jgi:hypothetical protein
MEVLSKPILFGGGQIVANPSSDVCGRDMNFAAYLPPAAKTEPCA